MMSAESRAERRLGFTPSEEVLEYARKLTEQKIQVKELPEDYFPLLYEDVIVETYSMACINAVGELNRRKKDVQYLSKRSMPERMPERTRPAGGVRMPRLRRGHLPRR